MTDDDYQLIPKHELDSLRQELEKLKKNPLGDLPEGESLIEEVKSLNASIKKLVDLFANTEAELAKEYAEHNPLDEMKTIKEQNEQIAQGILALADLIKASKDEMTRTIEDSKPKQSSQSIFSTSPGSDFTTPSSSYSSPVQSYNAPTQVIQTQPNAPAQPLADPFDLPDMPPVNQPLGLPPQVPAAPQKKKGLFGR